MRSRRPAPEEVADVARRRLELLSAELAGIRPAPSDDTGSRSSPDLRDGLGEHSPRPGDVPGATGREPLWADQVPDRPPGRHAHRPISRGAAAARWVEDRLPATLQGRVRLTGSHLAVVALVLAVGTGLTLWWVARADGDVTTLPGVPVVGAPAAGQSPTGAATTPASSGGGAGSDPSGAGPAGTGSALAPAGAATSSGGTSPVPGASVGPAGVAAGSGGGSVGSIVVDVTGKVRRPGIATLPTGSRVVDAIEAAGGARDGARLGTLNLARVLADGEQVVVGRPAPTGVAAPAASAVTSGAAVALVNVNTATQAQLEELPGVGPVTALAILDYRTENGPFASVDALLEVSGIGDATLAKIAPYVTL